MKDEFAKFARSVTDWLGSLTAVTLSFVLIATWVAGGLWFGYGSEYQMIANTGTTIVTFLMVFVIQNSQNHDTKAIQLKLDELIRSGSGRNRLLELQDMSGEELQELEEQFKRLQKKSEPKRPRSRPKPRSEFSAQGAAITTYPPPKPRRPRLR